MAPRPDRTAKARVTQEAFEAIRDAERKASDAHIAKLRALRLAKEAAEAAAAPAATPTPTTKPRRAKKQS